MNKLERAILADLEASDAELMGIWRRAHRVGRLEEFGDQVPGVAIELIRAPRVQERDVDEAA